MKARILFIVAFSLITLTSFAQRKANDNKAILFAREAATQLHLNELEYIKFRNLMIAKFEEIDEAAIHYKEDQAMYQEAVAQIETRYDEKVIAILPYSSQLAYLPLKANIHESAMAVLSSKPE